MRKIVDLILLGFLFLFLFWQKDTIAYKVNYLLTSPCDKPITYRVGEVDKGYGLSSEEFLKKIEEAGQIWSKIVDKDLFAYKKDGEITVNLIYTERQSMADNLDRLESDLKGSHQSLDSLKNEYNKAAADFERKLESFKQEVSYWNKQGGAPPDVYSRLTSEQSELQAEADRLNNLARQLNLSVKEYNTQVGQFNQNLETYKEAVSAKPEAGLYDGTVPKIDIYLTSSDQELLHTLAHEMGHALSLPHLEDAKAIMYPLTNEVVRPTTEEIAVLRIFCQKKNLDLVLEQLRKKIQQSITGEKPQNN